MRIEVVGNHALAASTSDGRQHNTAWVVPGQGRMDKVVVLGLLSFKGFAAA